jgi:hypothetical protein
MKWFKKTSVLDPNIRRNQRNLKALKQIVRCDEIPWLNLVLCEFGGVTLHCFSFFLCKNSDSIGQLSENITPSV